MVTSVGRNWQELNGINIFHARYKYGYRTNSGYGSVPTIAIDGGNGGAENDPDALKTHGVDAIAVYSFALKPEEHQPSGTCNFSRIDNAQLIGRDLTVETTRTSALRGERCQHRR